MLTPAQTAQAADERWYKGNVQQFQSFPGVRDFLSLLKLPIRRFFRGEQISRGHCRRQIAFAREASCSEREWEG